MVKLTLPDGQIREYSTSVSGADVALDIGPGLAKAALAVRINDEMNFWGSDRFDLIEDYIRRPDFYKFDAYERMLNINSGM